MITAHLIDAMHSFWSAWVFSRENTQPSMNENTVPCVYASVKKTTEGVKSLAVFKLCGMLQWLCNRKFEISCAQFIFLISKKGLGRVRCCGT